MRRSVLAAAIIVGFLGSAMSLPVEDPKYTIKDVMKKAHGRGENLVAKVTGGKATDKEKENLVELYESMPMNKPPKGDAASYKKLADAMLEAAKGVKNGDKDAVAKLKAAVNCKKCHDAHK